MDTWGISGPEFLLIYSGSFIASWAIVLVAREKIRGASGTSAGAGRGSPGLGIYEAAMLNGGGRLVLASALSRLRESGSIQLAGNGVAVPSGPLPVDAGTLESHLYARVQRYPVAATRLLDAGAADTVLSPIRDGLRERGLVPDAGQVAAMRRQSFWFAPVLALGAARLIAGSANHHPVSYLVLLMIVSLGIAVSLSRTPRDVRTVSRSARFFCLPRTTRSGADLLKRLSMVPADGGGSPFGPAGLAGLVAIGGLGVLTATDAQLASALGVGGGSSSSDSSGCGGGGCGGGGCGG